ncbi:hypothetical protein [Mesorhizobium sp. M1163]|uniref:hypothetical protein n=1 Tax=Mesorhizobium sp. M1163 TaxID=2957065 RepID=UPI0033383C24
MILKAVDVLPQGLINSRQKFGVEGQTFMESSRGLQRARAKSAAQDIIRCCISMCMAESARPGSATHR